MVLAHSTEAVTWECPVCHIDNDDFLFEGEPLPPELCCDFCGHESGLIEWDEAEKEEE